MIISRMELGEVKKQQLVISQARTFFLARFHKYLPVDHCQRQRVCPLQSMNLEVHGNALE
jgi:hypothetical protein